MEYINMMHLILLRKNGMQLYQKHHNMLKVKELRNENEQR